MYKSGFCILLFLILTQTLKSQTPLVDTVVYAKPINIAKNIIVNPQSLTLTFNRLNSIQSGADSTFTIVHFGDSHIQMGYFSGIIEKNLQSAFGDAGSGILFPYSACKSVGPTSLKSVFTGIWESNNITKNASNIPIGVKCYGLKTLDQNSKFSFSHITEDKNTEINAISILHGANNYELFCNNYKRDTLISDPSSNWQVSRFYSKSKSSDYSFTLKKTVESQSEFSFYGVLFETSENRGIQYHHCGVVSAQFTHICKNTPLLISQLAYLKPNLIIFSYGSNESYLTNFDPVTYAQEITKMIDSIKSEIPGVEILITSAPDTKSNDYYPLHKNEINRVLKEVAEKTESAYWDLDAVMGGDKTMDLWRNAGLALKDKLHFSVAGYQLQGNLLSLAFLKAYNETVSNPIITSGLQSEINRQMSVFPKIENVLQPRENTNTNTITKSNSIKYVVLKGDTLYGISKKYNCSISSIEKANNLTSSVIKIGETLIIVPNEK